MYDICFTVIKHPTKQSRNSKWDGMPDGNDKDHTMRIQ